jgi:ubiquinone/menaquinone biosynthesis C-methylase UbiE
VAYRRLTHRNFRRWEECVTLVRWLDARPTDRILDIGCGDGWWDERITRSGCQLDGIDIDDERLAIARQLNDRPGSRYHHMNAARLEFADASFDKAVSMCVIEHFADEHAVLAEVARVLKPGARFILSADSLSNPQVTTAERERHRTRYAVNTFYTIETLAETLAGHGFDLEEAHYILTTPTTLALARLTWWLDDFERSPSAARRWLSEAALAAAHRVGRVVSWAAEGVARRKDGGLTIVARARRRT